MEPLEDIIFAGGIHPYEEIIQLLGRFHDINISISISIRCTVT